MKLILFDVCRVHPAVIALANKVHDMETYLIQTMLAIKQCWMPTINCIYVILLLMYILMFFYIYIAFAEVSAQSDKSSSQVVYSTLDNIFTTVLVILSLGIALIPLYKMAFQAQAWVAIKDKCRSTSVQNSSKIMKGDPMYFFKHHEQLLMSVAWYICGFPLLVSVLVSTVSGYCAVVWASIIFPAIQDHIDDLKNELTNTTSTLLS